MFNGKNKKKTFLAAMTMLLVSAIVITSASFAWFSLGKSAAVNNIDIKVKSTEGILISTEENGTYGAEIQGADLKGLENNYFSNLFDPASSNFSGTTPVFYRGGIADGKIKTTAVTEEENCGLYAFDVYIKYVNNDASATTTVKVGGSSITVSDPDEGDTDAAGNAVVKNEAVAKAFRVGFIAGSQSCMFANDATANDTNPITKADTFDVTSGVATGVTGSYACNVAIAGETSSTAQLTLNAGVNKVRVYVWMEGQDANCVDEMASQKLSINLVFEQI